MKRGRRERESRRNERSRRGRMSPERGEEKKEERWGAQMKGEIKDGERENCWRESGRRAKEEKP